MESDDEEKIICRNCGKIVEKSLINIHNIMCRNQRHFPAINWLSSYSLYTDRLDSYWDERFDDQWSSLRVEAMGLLEQESQLNEIVRLVGIDALSRDERMVMETAKSLREDFLHQNAFHEIDTYASMDKQFKMLRTIVNFHHVGLDALRRGAPMNKLFNLPVREQIARMRYLEEKDIAQIDKLDDVMREQVNGIVPVGGDTNAA